VLDDIASGDSPAAFSRPNALEVPGMMGPGYAMNPIDQPAPSAQSLFQERASQRVMQRSSQQQQQPDYYQMQQQMQQQMQPQQYYPQASASPLPPADLPPVPQSRLLPRQNMNTMITSQFTQRPSYDNPIAGVDPTSPSQVSQLPQMGGEGAALPPQMFENTNGFVQQPVSPIAGMAGGMAGYPRGIPFRGDDMSGPGSLLQIRATQQPLPPAVSLLQKREALLSQSQQPPSRPAAPMGLRAPSPFMPFGAPEGAQHGPPMPAVPPNAYGLDPIFGRRDTVHR